MRNFIETILNAFSLMDIDTLHVHLKEGYSYHDAPRDVFLHEVEKVFLNFQHSGDTELIMYEGKCFGKNCPNCGKRGYRFVGNHSNNYLDLILKTEGDNIVDINSCAKFKSHIKIHKLKYKKNIVIPKDERITFVPTSEYITKLNAATIAWNEIVTLPPRILNFNDLCYWVDKHAIAYELFEDKEPFDCPMKWSPFLLIFPELYGFKEYLLKNIDVIMDANLVIDTIQSEEQLLEWLMMFEDVGTDAPHGLKYSFRKKEDFYWWNYFNPIYFQDEVHRN